MPPTTEVADMLHLTGQYYRRLRELLAEVPDGSLAAKIGEEGLTIEETVRHVCQCDLWYLNVVDGGARSLTEVRAGCTGLAELLDGSERVMLAFLQEVTEELLCEPREVPAWWAEGCEPTARLVLVHSLAHKYYHCGQLQSIVNSLTSA